MREFELKPMPDGSEPFIELNKLIKLLRISESGAQANQFVEDGIVKPQKNGTENIEDYVHNHVLRATFHHQPMGMELNNGNVLEAGNSFVYATSLDMSNTDWVPENCSVVAVLYDDNLKTVLQAETVPVVSR